MTALFDAAPAFTAAQLDNVSGEVVHHFDHHVTTAELFLALNAARRSAN